MPRCFPRPTKPSPRPPRAGSQTCCTGSDLAKIRRRRMVKRLAAEVAAARPRGHAAVRPRAARRRRGSRAQDRAARRTTTTRRLARRGSGANDRRLRARPRGRAAATRMRRPKSAPSALRRAIFLVHPRRQRSLLIRERGRRQHDFTAYSIPRLTPQITLLRTLKMWCGPALETVTVDTVPAPPKFFMWCDD